jgi:hypothetical protein
LLSRINVLTGSDRQLGTELGQKSGNRDSKLQKSTSSLRTRGRILSRFGLGLRVCEDDFGLDS